MDEQAFDGHIPGFLTTDGDAPTPEQAAILGYLNQPFDGTLSRAQAAALISQAENDPASRERLQAWHHDKYRLHPDLFTPPQRSFREARWWQARIADDSFYNRSFQSPSLNQTLVVLESLDRQEPGWEREAKNRRETRFMNELAALAPDLCKPGSSYPQALPAGEFSSSVEAPAAVPPPPPPFAAPSAPFVPGTMSAPFAPGTAPSKPAWTPDTPPALSVPPLLTPSPSFQHAPAGRRRRGSKWPLWLLLLAGIYAVGAGAYAWWHRTPLETVSQVSTPTPGPVAANIPAADNPKSAGRYAPLPAQESRQRAIAKHPELSQAGSLLNAKFIAAYRILESQHSPRLLQPDWPEKLADEFASTAPPASAEPKTAAASPTPAAPKAAATPAPAAPKATPPPSTPPTAQRTAASSPTPPATTPPVSPPLLPHASTAAAAPSATPEGPLFVTLDAVNKSRVNNYSYSWSPYYYADYDISFRQTVGIEAKVRNMTQRSTAVILRWMFFGRKTSNNERYVFSAAQKRIELAPGQTTADVLDSPMLQSKAAVYYSYGMHYYSGSKYEGWLVQVLPENSDAVLKQVGSSGYIEDFGKRPDLTAMLKEQLTH